MSIPYYKPTFPINPNGLTNVMRYTGESWVPRDIRRQRARNLEMMRRFGAPVIIKHMYSDADAKAGRAVASPNFSDIYGQTRHDDPLSHGVGFVGAENGSMIVSDNEWVSPDGVQIVVSESQPALGWTPAPKYRGYGPGHLTYIIMPDAAEDVFKLNEAGALIRIQTAQVQMGWYPEVNDNDLIITCQIDHAEKVVETYERYMAKMTNPISMRGVDRLGRREYSEDFGNRHVTDQQFEMTLLPEHDTLYEVEVDR